MSTPGGTSGSGEALSVVPDEVRDVGSYVYHLADTLGSALDAAAREVQSLTGGSWAGAASTGFGTGWNDVNDGGRQIIAALADLAAKLGVTADSYQQRDESNSGALSSSTLDLPPLP
ncbi:WXG100 family type VII secretion target [Nocardia sp. NPDC049220]|uniref:WXG100 family type VII secretion target n=1 Tax=Nocardia sp. NPDC049220 TaxID=3155273 RepID=UPI0033FE7513